MTPFAGSATASSMAWRRLPGPLSLRFVTVMFCARAGAPRQNRNRPSHRPGRLARCAILFMPLSLCDRSRDNRAAVPSARPHLLERKCGTVTTLPVSCARPVELPMHAADIGMRGADIARAAQRTCTENQQVATRLPSLADPVTARRSGPGSCGRDRPDCRARSGCRPRPGSCRRRCAADAGRATGAVRAARSVATGRSVR